MTRYKIEAVANGTVVGRWDCSSEQRRDYILSNCPVDASTVQSFSNDVVSWRDGLLKL